MKPDRNKNNGFDIKNELAESCNGLGVVQQTLWIIASVIQTTRLRESPNAEKSNEM